ncbi:hypothetical protein FOA52_002917 [Chlamydomonas sp. UWO 241]|nr:hypothetical protein FOA52_002917 [Chlamydomonas sp. UWO 241]
MSIASSTDRIYDVAVLAVRTHADVLCVNEQSLLDELVHVHVRQGKGGEEQWLLLPSSTYASTVEGLFGPGCTSLRLNLKYTREDVAQALRQETRLEPERGMAMTPLGLF